MYIWTLRGQLKRDIWPCNLLPVHHIHSFSIPSAFLVQCHTTSLLIPPMIWRSPLVTTTQILSQVWHTHLNYCTCTWFAVVNGYTGPVSIMEHHAVKIPALILTSIQDIFVAQSQIFDIYTFGLTSNQWTLRGSHQIVHRLNLSSVKIKGQQISGF